MTHSGQIKFLRNILKSLIFNAAFTFTYQLSLCDNIYSNLIEVGGVPGNSWLRWCQVDPTLQS